MKKVLFLLCILLACQRSFSQSLSLFDIDESNYPLIKAKLLTSDTKGKQLRPELSDLTLIENGVKRKIVNISCPKSVPLSALSSVLVMDVSGSMQVGQPKITNMDLAKRAASTWVNSIPLGACESAVASFDNVNYMNQDFTTNKSKLQRAIDRLVPQGSTNYDAALITPMAGGLQVTKSAKFQKVILLFSDGLPSSDPETSRIIEESKSQNCKIFCLSFGFLAPKCMKDIAEQTGGRYFEEIKTLEQAEQVARIIFNETIGKSACSISWESSVGCLTQAGNIQLTWLNQISTANYVIEKSKLASLIVNPSYVSFGKVTPNKFKDTTITLTALNADYIVHKVTNTSRFTFFSVTDTTFPMVIPKNTSKSITLRFAPTDSSWGYPILQIETNFCTSFISASGGFPERKVQTLKLTKPNGGEEFAIGSDTIIAWSGIAPSDSVSLEYSTDNGIKWQTITTKATNLQYIWKDIPKPASNQCKLMIKQNGSTNSNLVPGTQQHDLLYSARHYDVVWSPDGLKIAVVCNDDKVRIWDVSTGKKVIECIGRGVSWSPDGSRFVTGGSTGPLVALWDYATKKVLQTFNVSGSAVSWSPNGLYIVAEVSAYSSGGKASIFDANTGAEIAKIDAGGEYYRDIEWSPDSRRIATITMTSNNFYNYTNIWDVKNWTKLYSVGHPMNKLVRTVEWSPDSRQFLTTAYQDLSAIIWNGATGAKLKTLEAQSYVSDAHWSPDGSKIVTTSMYDSIAIVWDSQKGIKLYDLKHDNVLLYAKWSADGFRISTSGSRNYSTTIWSTAKRTKLFTLLHTGSQAKDEDLSHFWSPDGSRIATAYGWGLTKVWFVGNEPIQEDMSDSVFRIVAPKATAIDVDLGQTIVGTTKDTIVRNFILTKSIHSCRIDSVYFRGKDASSFRLLSKTLPLIVQSANGYTAEFEFTPINEGIHTAEIVIITPFDTLVQKLQAEGVAQQVAILTGALDFGEVELGKVSNADTVVVKNLTGKAIEISNVIQMGPDMSQFEIQGGGLPFVLEANQSRKLAVTFKPSHNGRTSGQIGCVYNGVGSPLKTQLFGTGIGATVKVSDDSAFTDETKIFKIEISNVSSEKIASLGTNFEATIRFESTVLSPINGADFWSSSDSTYMIIKGKVGSSTVVAQLPLIAHSGGVSETMVDIVQAGLKDDLGNVVDYDFETVSGKFTLLGVKVDTVTSVSELFNVTSPVSIKPNPANENIELQYSTHDSKSCQFTIVNLLGQPLYTTQLAPSQNGHKIIDVSYLPVGQYYAVFFAGTMNYTSIITIMK
ncbi:MAG: choice-of-anchor D domain-containing protein [Candidatus Kapaibacterium sp.]